MSDTIADMLSHIANANHKFKETIEMPASRVRSEIARVLKEEGYINHFKVAPDQKQGVLKMTLKYTPQKERAINGLKRVSRPGLRRYAGAEEIPNVQNGLGIAIVSTSKGLMTGHQARQQRLGGEILCIVW